MQIIIIRLEFRSANNRIYKRQFLFALKKKNVSECVCVVIDLYIHISKFIISAISLLTSLFIWSALQSFNYEVCCICIVEKYWNRPKSHFDKEYRYISSKSVYFNQTINVFEIKQHQYSAIVFASYTSSKYFF